MSTGARLITEASLSALTDRIAALEAENERLEGFMDELVDLRVFAAKAKAENERLRKVVEAASAVDATRFQSDYAGPPAGTHLAAALQFLYAALAALDKKEEG